MLSRLRQTLFKRDSDSLLDKEDRDVLNMLKVVMERALLEGNNELLEARRLLSEMDRKSSL